MRKLITRLFAAALLLSPHSSIFLASADARETDALIRVEGVIASVDTSASTVTINPTRATAAGVPAAAGGDPVTLHVTANTAITLDGSPARLYDLKRGFSAGASYDPGTFEAARIPAEGFAEIRGTIRDVGFAQHSRSRSSI